MINEVITYVTNHWIELIILFLLAIFVNIIWESLKIIFKPLNDFSAYIRKKIILFIKNPILPSEIIISGPIQAISKHDFIPIVKKGLLRVLNRSIQDENSIFKFSYVFGSFSTEIEIIPLTIPESPDIENDVINTVSIIVRSENTRLRNLKEDILSVRAFIFKNLVDILRTGLNFNPDNHNETLLVTFRTPPMMMNKIRDLQIRELHIEENNLNILIKTDRIDITGDIEEPIIEKFVNLIKINLVP
jgi:hypothetical protein